MPPSDSHLAPWETYAKALFQFYGYPLWHADPEEDEQYGRGEVELGSVGRVDEGTFCHLFKAGRAKGDKFNQGRVPESFVCFELENMDKKKPRPVILKPYVMSRHISNLSVSGDASVNLTSLATAGGSLSFSCSQDTGAILVLEPPAMQTKISRRRHIVTYLRTHFETWLEYAREAGYNIKQEDLCQKKNGPISDPLQAQCAGTLISGQDSETDLSAQSTRQERDQCLFFNYYTVKKRLWFDRVIKAAAGPHQLPPGGPDLEGNEPVGCEADSDDETQIMEGPSAATYTTYNPVAHLLDYIISHSEADMAIASDRDLIAIFGGAGLPEEIPVGLEAYKPEVEVDGSGVGTVTVDPTWLDQLVDSENSIPIVTEYGLRDENAQSLPGSPQATLDDLKIEQAIFDLVDPSWEQNKETEYHDDSQTAKHRKAEMAAGESAAKRHTGSITALTVSPDSKWVTSRSDDATIILWHTKRQEAVHKWESHGGIVLHLAFSPGSALLACSGGDGCITVRDMDGGEPLATLVGHTQAVHTVVWSPDGTKLASGSDDKTVSIWDGQTYETLHVLEGHSAMITFVVSPTTASTSRPQLPGMVWTAVFDQEDNRIATASEDDSVRIWKVETGEELLALHEHGGSVGVVAFSDDGKQILSGSSYGALRICDSFSGEGIVTLQGHGGMVNAAAFSPDGLYIASASSDKTVRLWRRKDGTNMHTFEEHSDAVTHVVFSPDGVTLSSGSDDGSVCVRVLKDIPVVSD
ncbi:WD40-repeat-containing domain protein [Dichomitus squalens]|nr:WD40-repeat-containing domain protein [Dichomitus squalens]